MSVYLDEAKIQNNCHASREKCYNLMITLERCKQILNKGNKKINDEDIKLLREYLYLLAKLQIESEEECIK